MNEPMQIEGHVTVVHRMNGENKAMVVCSCRSEWSVYQSGNKEVDGERIRESIKSHHISVGLKPSEVL